MYADLTSSLTDLLKGSPAKSAPLLWTSEHQNDFEKAKIALTSEPALLHIHDPSQPVYLHTDWSTKAIGGWIGQERDGRIVPIAYESRKLRPAERNYSPYDGELLALVHCIKTFRPYVHGNEVIIRTDQKALQWLLGQKKMSPRQYRWLDDLQTICPTLQWIKGTENTIADALSRRAQDEEIGIQVALIDADDLDTDFKNKILDSLPKDDDLQNIIANLKKSSFTRYTFHDGLLWYEGSRLVIPSDLCLSLLHDHHDSPTAGHPSKNLTYDLLAHHYHWPRMEKDVHKYVTSCSQCQRNKTSNRRPAGLLQPLPIPDRPWSSISLDFITQLPRTSSGHDTILVFVDRLTKMVHLCPGKTTDTAPQVALRFLDFVFRYHGLPRQIVSDRDSRFTGRFWRSLMDLLQIR